MNAWRLSAKSSAENIPNKKEVAEVGKKRQAIYQYKRKQKNADNEEASECKPCVFALLLYNIFQYMRFGLFRRLNNKTKVLKQ